MCIFRPPTVSSTIVSVRRRKRAFLRCQSAFTTTDYIFMLCSAFSPRWPFAFLLCRPHPIRWFQNSNKFYAASMFAPVVRRTRFSNSYAFIALILRIRSEYILLAQSISSKYTCLSLPLATIHITRLDCMTWQAYFFPSLYLIMTLVLSVTFCFKNEIRHIKSGFDLLFSIYLWINVFFSFFFFIVHRYPFNDSEHASLFAKISRGQFLVPECLTSKARCMIRSLLRKEPEERILSEDILLHPWMTVDENRDFTKSSTDQMVPDICFDGDDA